MLDAAPAATRSLEFANQRDLIDAGTEGECWPLITCGALHGLLDARGPRRRASEVTGSAHLMRAAGAIDSWIARSPCWTRKTPAADPIPQRCPLSEAKTLRASGLLVLVRHIRRAVTSAPTTLLLSQQEGEGRATAGFRSSRHGASSRRHVVAISTFRGAVLNAPHSPGSAYFGGTIRSA
jgi:hypothetical protein